MRCVECGFTVKKRPALCPCCGNKFRPKISFGERIALFVLDSIVFGFFTVPLFSYFDPDYASTIWFFSCLSLSFIISVLIGRPKHNKKRSAPTETVRYSSPSNTTDDYTTDKYIEHRRQIAEHFEHKFDFSSVDSIEKIRSYSYPGSSSIPSPTEDIDYYLVNKAYAFEKDNQLDLAIACLRKSNEIRMKNTYNRSGMMYIDRSDYYPLVKMLARSCRKNEAYEEKEKIDNFINSLSVKMARYNVASVIASCKDLHTTLVIMSVHGCACSECAKYQGRVFSIDGKDRRFPKIPDSFFEFGGIHKNCHCSFYPFNYGISNPELSNTLLYYDTKWKYRKNIIAFSNRPFVDDRKPDVIKNANTHLEELRLQKQKDDEYYDEQMIFIEYNRGLELLDYNWLKENYPQKCPKSVTGYRRMKTQNTANFKLLYSFAQSHGRTLANIPHEP